VADLRGGPGPLSDAKKGPFNEKRANLEKKE